MKRAYVTLLCNGDAYVPGVETLGRSLEASGSREPRILLTTPESLDAAHERLSPLGWQIREVESIARPTGDPLLFPRFANVFTKLRAWELDDIECVVLLDADILVLQNIDDLFERPHFAAAPDFFLPDRFNSGVMVLTPSSEVFRQMMAEFSVAKSYDGGDQGFLNTFFSNWYAMPVEHRLPVAYNVPNFIYQFMHGHSGLVPLLEREVKAIHFLVQKPWQAGATLTGGSELWWKTYFQVHPEQGRGWKDRVHALQDRTFERLTATFLGG